MMFFASTSQRCLALVLAALLGACAAEPGGDQAAEHQNDEAKLLSVDLNRDHGWAALRTERYDEAASFFERILNDRKNDPDAMLGLGEARLGQNRLDDALRRFEHVDRKANPMIRAEAFQGAAIVWLRQGQHEEAEAALNKAIELEPKLWRCWNGLGRVRDIKKDYVAARYAYRQAIRISPKTALLHNNLGFSLLASGDPAYAETSFRRALDLDPDLEVASANLRLALALQGRYASATAGTSSLDQARIMNNVGYAALLRGDLDKARSLFLGAMERDPGFFKEARRNLAFLETLEADRIQGTRP